MVATKGWQLAKKVTNIGAGPKKNGYARFGAAEIKESRLMHLKLAAKHLGKVFGCSCFDHKPASKKKVTRANSRAEGELTLIDRDDEEQNKMYVLESDIHKVSHLRIFFPTEPLKAKWDNIILALIVYSCAVVPFRICFEAEPEGHLWWFEVLITIFFMADVLATFNTATLDGDQFLINRKWIAFNYLKGTFLLDLLSSVPVELIELALENQTLAGDQQGAALGSLRLLRMLRLTRLMRCAGHGAGHGAYMFSVHPCVPPPPLTDGLKWIQCPPPSPSAPPTAADCSSC